MTERSAMPWDTASWQARSTAELEAKLDALRGLVESGALSERSAEQQMAEINIISAELERRRG